MQNKENIWLTLKKSPQTGIRAGFHITERVKNTEWRPDGDLVYEIKMVKECL